MASRGFTPHRTLCFAERSMRGGAGFTLVELMVAVSILAGGLVF
ncbi:MAG: prepilin-type N-terminal cleavage/methylation domain-containing protein, partial [Candidatus Omnitrophica bacterium]|nr:prepilin-type N-terminal cleavage/methylation domain-containing protein [Candidatus Omnitrophota bacterium]